MWLHGLVVSKITEQKVLGSRHGSTIKLLCKVHIRVSKVGHDRCSAGHEQGVQRVGHVQSMSQRDHKVMI